VFPICPKDFFSRAESYDKDAHENVKCKSGHNMVLALKVSTVATLLLTVDLKMKKYQI
jgi:hypothetical protein